MVQRLQSNPTRLAAGNRSTSGEPEGQQGRAAEAAGTVHAEPAAIHSEGDGLALFGVGVIIGFALFQAWQLMPRNRREL